MLNAVGSLKSGLVNQKVPQPFKDLRVRNIKFERRKRIQTGKARFLKEDATESKWVESQKHKLALKSIKETT